MLTNFYGIDETTVKGIIKHDENAIFEIKEIAKKELNKAKAIVDNYTSLSIGKLINLKYDENGAEEITRIIHHAEYGKCYCKFKRNGENIQHFKFVDTKDNILYGVNFSHYVPNNIEKIYYGDMKSINSPNSLLFGENLQLQNICFKAVPKSFKISSGNLSINFDNENLSECFINETSKPSKNDIEEIGCKVSCFKDYLLIPQQKCQSDLKEGNRIKYQLLNDNTQIFYPERGYGSGSKHIKIIDGEGNRKYCGYISDTNGSIISFWTTDKLNYRYEDIRNDYTLTHGVITQVENRYKDCSATIEFSKELDNILPCTIQFKKSNIFRATLSCDIKGNFIEMNKSDHIIFENNKLFSRIGFPGLAQKILQNLGLNRLFRNY